MDLGTHSGGWCPWRMCILAMKSPPQAAFVLGFIRCLPLSRHPHLHTCSSCKHILDPKLTFLTQIHVTSDFEAVVDEYLSHYDIPDSPDLVRTLTSIT
jgi:hypothetical protein